jgi:hypothetical protein
MVDQIHRRLIDEQVRMILERYIKKELGTIQAMDLLGLKRRQFFEWVKRYREHSEGFSVEYSTRSNRRLSGDKDSRILEELAVEKKLIEDPLMPIRFYNYSYIQDQLLKKYEYKISLPAIIDRAKKTVFTLPDLNRNFMTMRL